jgi:chromosomal replication initiation ATPase DnaA
MNQQLRLFDALEQDDHPSGPLIGEPNAAACTLLQQWRQWPGGALALVGPAGSGKSALARAWAEQTDAVLLRAPLDPAALEDCFQHPSARVVVEEAPDMAEEALMLAIDLARSREGAALLLTARTPPKAWRCTLADTRSRLLALACCEIEPPDLPFLAQLLQRHLRRRYLALEPEVAAYCAARLPRSYAAAADLADAMEEACRRAVEPLSHDVARRALARLYPDLEP